MATTPFSQEVARIVNGVLAEHHVSGKALATQLNRSEGYVSERRNGKAAWTTTDLDVIARLAGMTPVHLLSEITARARRDQQQAALLSRKRRPPP